MGKNMDSNTDRWEWKREEGDDPYLRRLFSLCQGWSGVSWIMYPARRLWSGSVGMIITGLSIYVYEVMECYWRVGATLNEDIRDGSSILPSTGDESACSL